MPSVGAVSVQAGAATFADNAATAVDVVVVVVVAAAVVAAQRTPQNMDHVY